MSAVLGLFGDNVRRDSNAVRGMLDAMRDRGIEKVTSWGEGEALLVIGRYEWEMESDFAGPAGIADDGRLVVAADASIYYRAQLRHSLEVAGVRPHGESAADFILAAYKAWGDDCASRLDGDFAFIVWDRQTRRCVCFRDFAGKRPLHYATLGGGLAVASSIGGVAAHPDCPQDLNVDVIAATAGGLLFSAGPETAYRAISVLPNACRLSWSSDRGTVGPERFWEAPVGQAESRLTHDEAAEELRELLVVATRERMSAAARSSVWMSGGWDSTAIFAAAQVAANRDGKTPPVPVSISYPEGDPGREDEIIADVADRWNSHVHWLNIADIPFMDGQDRTAARDEPYKHLYENWNGALAEGSRASGSRVALDGNGGDQLFQNSDVFLADLFRRGKWLTLGREWPARPRGGYREMFATVIQPNLGPTLLGAARVARGGRPLRHYLERKLPPWLNADYVRLNRLPERDLEYMTRPVSSSRAEREIDWHFTCLFISRAFARLFSLALAKGVELRSPLSDRRVIEFALSRPWWERSSGKETKLLLRSSMRGLLPDQVLAPRTHRTGVTSGYSHGAMTKIFPTVVEEVRKTPLLLEELGVIDSKAFYEAATRYVERGGDAFFRVNLFYTLQTELWLRARLRPETQVEGSTRVPAALAE